MLLTLHNCSDFIQMSANANHEINKEPNSLLVRQTHMFEKEQIHGLQYYWCMLFVVRWIVIWVN